MSTGTAIEWTEVTWNPTIGCDRISPGCDHCYALTLAKRLKAMGQAKYQRDGDPRTSGPGFGVTVHENALFEPLRWRRPRKGVRELHERHRPCPCPHGVCGQDLRDDGAGAAAPVPGTHQEPRRLRRLLASQKFVDVVWTEMERLSEDDAVPLARPVREDVRKRVPRPSRVTEIARAALAQGCPAFMPLPPGL
ncbi:hypothetical protein GCM10022206_06210 [Streptomyces chiangmaiensis]